MELISESYRRLSSCYCCDKYTEEWTYYYKDGDDIIGESVSVGRKVESGIYSYWMCKKCIEKGYISDSVACWCCD